MAFSKKIKWKKSKNTKRALYNGNAYTTKVLLRRNNQCFIVG